MATITIYQKNGDINKWECCNDSSRMHDQLVADIIDGTLLIQGHDVELKPTGPNTYTLSFK
jgi:hypothetical protein